MLGYVVVGPRGELEVFDLANLFAAVLERLKTTKVRGLLSWKTKVNNNNQAVKKISCSRNSHEGFLLKFFTSVKARLIRTATGKHLHVDLST